MELNYNMTDSRYAYWDQGWSFWSLEKTPKGNESSNIDVIMNQVAIFHLIENY